MDKFEFNMDCIPSEHVIDVLKNAIKRNSGDMDTIEILVGIGCDIFDVSWDTMVEILNCESEVE